MNTVIRFTNLEPILRLIALNSASVEGMNQSLRKVSSSPGSGSVVDAASSLSMTSRLLWWSFASIILRHNKRFSFDTMV